VVRHVEHALQHVIEDAAIVIDSRLHHRRDLLRVRDVLERVGVEQDEVRLLALLDGPGAT
jgi:hypothetical protein